MFQSFYVGYNLKKSIQHFITILMFAILFTACAKAPDIPRDTTSKPSPTKPSTGVKRPPLPPRAEITGLSSVEEKAFYSTDIIDIGLDDEELSFVIGYYKDYLHKNRLTIERFMYRAIPYLAYTKKVFRERGMPEELAYLAFIESGYNPHGVSTSSAKGLWQFIPRTGTYFGLKQDWWMDERLDIQKSTEKAAEYLAKLYKYFDNDWLLALAAYNAGEGRIERALKAANVHDFFDLLERNHTLKNPVSAESQQYVPRMIAMCKIMRNFEELGFSIDEHSIKNKPFIKTPAVTVTAKPGTDLATIARKIGMSWQDFSAYNLAFRRYMTPSDRETQFYVPYHLQGKAVLASESKDALGWSLYRVVSGDNLTKISKKVGVPISVLRQCNKIPSVLRIGMVLRVPARVDGTVSNVAYNPSPEEKIISKSVYYLRSGDTIGAIARRHDLTDSQLLAANPSIKNVRTLAVGQKIIIPKYGIPSQTSTDNLVIISTSKYKVRSGDSFSRIASRHGLTEAQLAKANPRIKNRHRLSIGQTLSIPQYGKAVEAKKSISVPAGSTYKVKRGDSFGSIAERHGLSQTALAKANPQIKNRHKLSIGQNIYIPKSSVELALAEAKVESKQAVKEEIKSSPKTESFISEKRKTENLESTSAKISRTHTIKRGESLYLIAKKYSLSVAEVKRLNPTASVEHLKIGQKLIIGYSSDTKVSTAKANTKESTSISYSTSKALQVLAKSEVKVSPYKVKKGDSFYSIAKKYGISQEMLSDLNPQVKSRTQLSIGQELRVPASNTAKSSTGTTKSPSIEKYSVQKGDSAWSIARKFRMDPKDFLKLNNLSMSDKIKIGDVVKVYSH